jgi:diacylglycerol kinase family enzyme
LEKLIANHASESGQGEFELTWAVTERPRHATDLVRAGTAEGYDVVVAVGGDGTVHETVNGLMQIEAEHRPMLGILPVGSGNDFAYNVGVPEKVEDAARCLFSSDVRIVDIGVIQDGNGRIEYWDNSISVGFGAVNLAARKLKLLRGFFIWWR